MSITQKEKEVALKIVGNWHSEDDNIMLIFDFPDNQKSSIPYSFTVKGKKSGKSRYEIHVHPSPPEQDNEYHFYLRLGFLADGKKNWYLKKLTSDELIFQEMDGYTVVGEEFKYFRKADLGIADEILKGLDSI